MRRARCIDGKGFLKKKNKAKHLIYYRELKSSSSSVLRSWTISAVNPPEALANYKGKLNRMFFSVSLISFKKLQFLQFNLDDLRTSELEGFGFCSACPSPTSSFIVGLTKLTNTNTLVLDEAQT